MAKCFKIKQLLIMLVVGVLLGGPGWVRAECPDGDLTSDCRVDLDDLVVLADQWLGSSGDMVDFAVISANWLKVGLPLVINEFMASNGLTLATTVAGQDVYPDWIEIYNPSTEAIDLTGWYLSDSSDNLGKWQFPDGLNIGSDSYLIIFASGKTQAENPGNYPYLDESGYYHTNFNLAAGGEYLALAAPDGAGGVIVAHEYTPDYPDQSTDISYGLCNFTGLFVPLSTDVSYRVPTSSADEADWMTEGFDDSVWAAGTTGLGFGISSAQVAMVAEDAVKKVLVPSDGSFGADWTGGSEPFDDSGWIHGTPITPGKSGGVGYEKSTGNEDYISYDVGTEMFGIRGTCYIRIPFTCSTEIDAITSLKLMAFYDDGFVAYLNGTEVYRVNFVGTPQWDSFSSTWYDAVVFEEFDISEHIDLLRGGDNMLAIHGLNTSLSSTDFIISVKLLADLNNPISTDVGGDMQNENATLWSRIDFEIEQDSPEEFFDKLILRMIYEDGFAAYLNGVKIAEDNAPASPGWNSAALSDRSLSTDFVQLDITSYLDVLHSGTNVLAIHGLNDSASNSVFFILPKLTAYKSTGTPYYLVSATPGDINNDLLFTVADTKFSVDRGIYDAPFDVEITCATVGATIKYTTDGSAPSETNGLTYTGPISISSTTPLRAIACKAGWGSTNVDTQTYIFLDDVIVQPNNPAGFHDYWGWNPWSNPPAWLGADYEMDPDVISLHSATIVDDLKTIPIMSLVMDVNDMFSRTHNPDPARWDEYYTPDFDKDGVYTTTVETEGEMDVERPVSVELIYPDGTAGFQENCSVRIYGGVGRYPANKKHTLRLVFKNEYGPTTLKYPFFRNDAADEFNTIILRAGYNDSWHSGGGMHITDNWTRASQIDMGQAGSHGVFVHLYVNGLYWGLYNPAERPDAAFAASYYGGDSDDWDALNSGKAINDSSLDSWNTAQAIADDVVVGNILPQDTYSAISEYVDVPNLIDYMLVNFYAGNTDWDQHNWYAARRRSAGEGFKFFCWDAETTLHWWDPTNNKVCIAYLNSPSWFYNALRYNYEFRLEFADHAHKHLFNDGALTPAGGTARYQRMFDEIERAVVGELARWGDAQREDSLTYGLWVDNCNAIINNFFPVRSDIQTDFLREGDLYPEIDAPSYEINGSYRHGGQISSSDQLSMTASNGSIYYTTDGIDPRLKIRPKDYLAKLVPENAEKRVLVPTGDIGTTWRSDTVYNDSSWAVTDNARAVEFGFDDDYVTIANESFFDFTSQITISAWCNTSYYNRFWATMISKGSAWDIMVTGTNVLIFDINGVGVRAPVYDGRWHHLAAVYDGSTVSLYMDGQLTGTASTSGAIQLNDVNVQIASKGSDGNCMWSGMVDDVRIFDVALNEGQICALLNRESVTSGLKGHWKLDETSGSTAYDSSGYGNNGSLGGSCTWRDIGCRGVGYDTDPDYGKIVDLNVKTQMQGNNGSCYIRIPFSVDAGDLANFNFLTLKMKYDDGFVAYLNGTEVASVNAPNPLTWQSTTDNGNGHESSIDDFDDEYDLSAHIGLLQPGDNLLAVHGLNNSVGSTDFVISAELIACKNLPVDDITSPGKMLYTTAVTLPMSSKVRARVFDTGKWDWSALNEATYAVGPVVDNLRITEIMYHPADANQHEKDAVGNPNLIDEDFEFVELKNTGAEALNLNLVSFIDGIDFTFGDVTVAPGEYVLVVSDPNAFNARYPDFTGAIAGVYTGRLDNSGEKIRLRDAIDTKILTFDYGDGWYDITDGMGFSLTIKDPDSSDPNDWDEKNGWRPSAAIGGSPGFDDGGDVPVLGSIKINEILAHSNGDPNDWIELYNTTDTVINISGWFLSDSDNDFTRYEIAAGTSIAAHGYIVFTQDSHFGNVSDPGCKTPFALSENGETLYLHSGQDGVITGYSEEEDFGASESGVAFGRYEKSTGAFNFVAMATNTPGSVYQGAANSDPKVGPIVINEIMYYPYPEVDAEYLELLNISGSPVTLYFNAVPWKMTDGIDYTFPSGSPVTLAAGEYFLLVKNLAEFTGKYGAPVCGYAVWNDGSLSNGGESLEISMPGDLDGIERMYIRIDRVNYDDESGWPTEPDGPNGDSFSSLSRIVPSNYGNDVINWEANTPSAGVVNP